MKDLQEDTTPEEFTFHVQCANSRKDDREARSEKRGEGSNKRKQGKERRSGKREGGMGKSETAVIGGAGDKFSRTWKRITKPIPKMARKEKRSYHTRGE